MQITFIMREALQPKFAEDHYGLLCDTLRRELGRLSLGAPNLSQSGAFFDYFMRVKEVDLALDCVELFFKMVVALEEDEPPPNGPDEYSVWDGIQELNQRFREHGIGYEFSNGEIMRVDSELLHDEAVKPSLAVLRDKRFAAGR